MILAFIISANLIISDYTDISLKINMPFNEKGHRTLAD